LVRLLSTGIGAYIAGILMTKMGVPFWLVLPVAAVACFVIGLALGFPALRVQHHYLAFATLGFNVLVFLVMRNEEQLTGGTFGISNIRGRRSSAIRSMAALPFFYFAFVSVMLLAAVLWWLLRSPWGRAFAALRDNRSGPRAPGSTSRRTRCSRSRSARRAQASAASILRRSSISSSRVSSISRSR